MHLILPYLNVHHARLLSLQNGQVQAVIRAAMCLGVCWVPCVMALCRGCQVVSCEMIEAVGHENLPAYFAAISSLLKPGGQAVIQVSIPSVSVTSSS